MSKITLKELGLTPEEMKTLVEGAQRFLPPVEDPEDIQPIPAAEPGE